MTDDPAYLVALYPDQGIDRDSYDLYKGYTQRVLQLPKCGSCGKWHNPPRAICPYCWSTDLSQQPLSGRGTVFMSIILRQGKETPGISYPHRIAAAELEEQEGLRFVTGMIGLGNFDLAIGTPVEIAWIDREGAIYPQFRERQETVR